MISGVITLNSGNNWTASVDDLKASSSYIFKEVTDSSGTVEVESGGKISLTGTNDKKYHYTVSGGDVTNGSATITNTYVAPKTHVSITKAWKDENGSGITEDSSLPDAIYVKLKRTGTVDGNPVTQYRQSNGTFTTDESSAGSVELKKSENWTKTIEGLDIYADIVKQTTWTYSVYAETSGTSTESGKLISINGIQYVVSYGSAEAAAEKNVELTATNKKLPQTSLTVQKIWQNMDGNTLDEITKGHTETISVYLKRFTKDSSGKEENVGYYKLSDEVVSFVGSQDDATAITLTNANSYKATVSGLDEYLASVDDNGNVTKTPYYFELVSESGSWSTTSTDSTSSTSSTDSTSSTASTTSSTAGTGSTTSDTTSTSSTAGTTSSADTSSGSASESGGKITLNGKTYIVTYGDSTALTGTDPRSP